MIRLFIKTLFYLNLSSLMFILFLPQKNTFFDYISILLIISLSFLYFILRPPIIFKKKIRKSKNLIDHFENNSINSSTHTDIVIFTKDSILYSSFYNAVKKEFGKVNLINSLKIDFTPRLIIIPINTNLTHEELSYFKELTEKGINFLLECPLNNLIDFSGIKQNGHKKILFNKSFFSNKNLLNNIKEYEYTSTNASKVKDYLYLKTFNKSKIFSLSINYSSWAKKNLQGSFDFKKSFLNFNLQGIQTKDLREDKLRNNFTKPVIDIFDKSFFSFLKEQLKIPSIWYYPHMKKYAFIPSFDEDYFGENIFKTPMHDIQYDWFIMHDTKISNKSINKLINKNHSVNIHWNRFLMHANLNGCHFEYNSFEKQMKNFKSNFGISPISNRIHYLRWDKNSDHIFNILSCEGIKIDSTFGPGRNQSGYLFGTGFPYETTYKNGNFTGITEIPFQIHLPMGSSNTQSSLKLLEDAKEKYNTTITVLFHPYYCLKGTKNYDIYEKLIKYVVSDKTCFNTKMADLYDFWEKRTNIIVKSKLEEEKLHVFINNANKGSFSLSIPNHEKVNSISINGQNSIKTQFLEIAQGEFNIVINYLP